MSYKISGILTKNMSFEQHVGFVWSKIKKNGWLTLKIVVAVARHNFKCLDLI